jgi:hypothetical protein
VSTMNSTTPSGWESFMKACKTADAPNCT